MKNVFIITIFLSSCLFFSCKKNGIKVQGNYEYLKGNWKCIYTFGSYYGSPFFNDSTGTYINQTLQIDENGRYITRFVYDGYNNKQSGYIQNIEVVDSSQVMSDFFPNQKTAQLVTFKMLKPKNGTNIFYEPVITFMSEKSINSYTSNKETEGRKLIIAFLGNANIKVYCAYQKQ
jgi:hypothetical protein